MNKSECPQWIKQKAVNQTGKCKIDGLYCHKENERTNKVEFDRCEVYWKAKAEKQEKVIDDIEKEIRLFKTFAISGVWGKTQKDKCIKIFIEAMQKIIDKHKGGA